jgi:hypothetical protein
MDDEQWAACLATRTDEAEPGLELEDWLGSGLAAETAGLAGATMDQVIAQAREVTAAEVRAQALLGAGFLGTRRGPGYSGALDPGEYASPSAALAKGGPLDPGLPSGALLMFVEDAAGPDGLFTGASVDEAIGAIAALDRIEAYVHGRKHQAVAAYIRHRPAPGCQPEGPAGMPAVWEDTAEEELAHALAEDKWAAGKLLSAARDLAVKLPGTMRGLLSGDIRDRKAAKIITATADLDPGRRRRRRTWCWGGPGRSLPAAWAGRSPGPPRRSRPGGRRAA